MQLGHHRLDRAGLLRRRGVAHPGAQRLDVRRRLSPDRAIAKMVIPTPSRSRARTSLSTKVWDSRGQLRTM
ncbi:MAG: hypothetical protein JWM18_350 [Chloroflexi bacterium]|nr:hypothetical protein [Chloroflexota bacterium]